MVEGIRVLVPALLPQRARIDMLALTVPFTLLLLALWRRTGVLAALLLLALFVVNA